MSGPDAPLMTWRKSSRCDTNSCVEVMMAGDAVYLRDSKNPDGGHLSLSREDFGAFVAAIKAGLLQDPITPVS